MKEEYMVYLEKQFKQLINIDSTTGLYREIENYGPVSRFSTK